MTATIVSRQLVYDGWYKLWCPTVRIPGRAEVERHLEDSGGCAADPALFA